MNTNHVNEKNFIFTYLSTIIVQTHPDVDNKALLPVMPDKNLSQLHI